MSNQVLQLDDIRKLKDISTRLVEVKEKVQKEVAACLESDKTLGVQELIKSGEALRDTVDDFFNGAFTDAINNTDRALNDYKQIAESLGETL